MGIGMGMELCGQLGWLGGGREQAGLDGDESRERWRGMDRGKDRHLLPSSTAAQMLLHARRNWAASQPSPMGVEKG